MGNGQIHLDGLREIIRKPIERPKSDGLQVRISKGDSLALHELVPVEYTAI